VVKRLADSDARVRLRAAQGLIVAQHKEAVPVLVDLLASAPEAIAWRAEELLFRVAGELAPSIAAGDGSREARQKQRDGWAEWWRDHAAKVDLARVSQEPPHLGLTVVAQKYANEVWECDRAGKRRWTITNLDGPVDAQVLPGNRVLIAESGSSRVTERDLSGKVLWEKSLSYSPVVCQRLPNGNTFVATSSLVMEFAPDGTEVYSHSLRTSGFGRGSYGVNAAHKLPNGHILAITRRGVVYEVEAATGKILKTTSVGGTMMTSVEGLPGGRMLVVYHSEGKVVEFDANRKNIWQCDVEGAYHATRLPNGHTLISCQTGCRVVEVNRDGKIVWEQSTGENPPWRVHQR